MKLCNIWYPSFDMFMLTSVHVDATSHMSNSKYLGRCKGLILLLKTATNLEVITALQCREFWKASPNKNVSYSTSAWNLKIYIRQKVSDMYYCTWLYEWYNNLHMYIIHMHCTVCKERPLLHRADAVSNQAYPIGKWHFLQILGEIQIA